MSKRKTPEEMRRYALAKIEKTMGPLTDAMKMLGRLAASPKATSEEGIKADIALTDLTKAYAGLFEIICPRAEMEAEFETYRKQGRKK